MNAQVMRAPQYGLWSGLVPRSDNPANALLPVRCPDLIKLQLLQFRNEAKERAALQRLSGGGLWV